MQLKSHKIGIVHYRGRNSNQEIYIFETVSAHAPISVHGVLCRSFDQGSGGAYVDLAQHCI